MSKHRTKEEMFPLIEEWEQGALSQKEICARYNIEPSVFSYWRKKYNEAKNEVGHHFSEIKPGVESGFEICYPNGVVVRMATASTATIKSLVALI